MILERLECEYSKQNNVDPYMFFIVCCVHFSQLHFCSFLLLFWLISKCFLLTQFDLTHLYQLSEIRFRNINYTLKSTAENFPFQLCFHSLIYFYFDFRVQTSSFEFCTTTENSLGLNRSKLERNSTSFFVYTRQQTVTIFHPKLFI